jgi:hypothetical protein
VQLRRWGYAAHFRVSSSFPPRTFVQSPRGCCCIQGVYSEGCFRRRNVIPRAFLSNARGVVPECFCRGRESSSGSTHGSPHPRGRQKGTFRVAIPPPPPSFPPEYFFPMRGVLSAQAGIHPFILSDVSPPSIEQRITYQLHTFDFCFLVYRGVSFSIFHFPAAA